MVKDPKQRRPSACFSSNLPSPEGGGWRLAPGGGWWSFFKPHESGQKSPDRRGRPEPEGGDPDGPRTGALRGPRSEAWRSRPGIDGPRDARPGPRRPEDAPHERGRAHRPPALEPKDRADSNRSAERTPARPRGDQARQRGSGQAIRAGRPPG